MDKTSNKGEIMRNAQRLLKSKGNGAVGYAENMAERIAGGAVWHLLALLWELCSPFTAFLWPLGLVVRPMDRAFFGVGGHGCHSRLPETPWLKGFSDLSVGFSFGGHKVGDCLSPGARAGQQISIDTWPANVAR